MACTRSALRVSESRARSNSCLSPSRRASLSTNIEVRQFECKDFEDDEVFQIVGLSWPLSKWTAAQRCPADQGAVCNEGRSGSAASSSASEPDTPLCTDLDEEDWQEDEDVKGSSRKSSIATPRASPGAAASIPNGSDERRGASLRSDVMLPLQWNAPLSLEVAAAHDDGTDTNLLTEMDEDEGLGGSLLVMAVERRRIRRSATGNIGMGSMDELPPMQSSGIWQRRFARVAAPQPLNLGA